MFEKMNKKQVIRLTESQFHQIVKEAVKHIIKEEEFGNDFLSLVASAADEMPYWGYKNEGVVLENFLSIINTYPEKMRSANPKIVHIIKDVLADAENKYRNGGNEWDDFDDFIFLLKQLDNAYPKAVFAARKEYGNVEYPLDDIDEGVGDEYLDNFGKKVSRIKRFHNPDIDLSNCNEYDLDNLDSTRYWYHKKNRGKKTKGSTESRDFLRKQAEMGNPIIKYKRNPQEWIDNLMAQSDN